MIKKLKFKMLAIILGVLVLVFAAVLVSLNLFVRSGDTNYTYQMLEEIAANDGFPDALSSGATSGDQRGKPPADDDKPRMDRIFYVKLDTDGNVLEADTGRMFELSGDEAATYAREVSGKGTPKGTIKNLQFLIAEKDYGVIVVFAEKSIESQLLSRLTSTTLWVAGASCILLLALAVVLSNWAVRPVKDAFDRQRRFVSDASHELKTPLTIISANADLLENEICANQWLQGIKVQSNRMGALINDMLTLTRSDEQPGVLIARPFDLSDVVGRTLLEFESRAYEENKTLTSDITPGISLAGDRDQIRRLVALLLDNALTHSDSSGQIRVELKADGTKNRLTVGNSGAGFGEKDKEQVFERFYRSDASRSRKTGGYGLGLAIAKSIVGQHNGTITAEIPRKEWVEFTVRF